MSRWRTIVAIVAFFTAGAGGPVRVQAGPVVEPALWRAAGVVELSNPVPAPPLSLRDLSGELVDLRGLRGRVIMLYFWTTW
jgi:hypothetical protein